MTLNPDGFSMGGRIFGVRNTTPLEPVYPALMLVIDVSGNYARIMIPPDVWPAAPELLELGRMVSVRGWADSFPFVPGSEQVATELHLMTGNLH